MAFQPAKAAGEARAPPLCTSRPGCQASYSDDPTMKAIQRPPHASSLRRLSSLCLRRSFPRSTVRVVFSRSLTAQRSLKANSTNSTSRKHVTVVNDDGRVRWGELSAREKAARTTQQGINLVVVIAGVALTVCFTSPNPSIHQTRNMVLIVGIQGAVVALLYTEVFSYDSKTSHFNRAADRIKRDPKCIELLGDSKKIQAFGEPSWSRWARNRVIA